MNVLSIADSIDRLSVKIGQWASWLSLAMVLLICIDVILRYTMSRTETWILELEWHLFGILFLFSAAYTMVTDEHVRVDLFYNRGLAKQKALVNLFGTVLFLLPWCYVVITTSYQYAINSLSYWEGSPNPNGLPARYIIKGAICLAFGLILLQSVSMIIRSVDTIRKT